MIAALEVSAVGVDQVSTADLSLPSADRPESAAGPGMGVADASAEAVLLSSGFTARILKV